MIEQQFAEIVEAELTRQNISRSELARRMGVGRAYVTDYLNGRRSPGSDVIEKFFNALGLSPRLNAEPLERVSA